MHGAHGCRLRYFAFATMARQTRLGLSYPIPDYEMKTANSEADLAVDLGFSLIL